MIIGLLKRLPHPVGHWTGVAGVLVFATVVQSVLAQYEASDIDREYAIKAAYLYQFGRYVEWPSSAFSGQQSPLVIGVLGGNPFGGILDEIAHTKQIDGRPIVVRIYKSMADYTPSHILFIVATVDEAQKAEAIQKTKNTPVLLIGESPGFAEQGGTINFFVEQNRIRFEINMEVAKRDQLKISSKLLSLAKIVGQPKSGNLATGLANSYTASRPHN